MKDVFIVDGVRTAIGSHCGALSSIRTDDLGAVPLRALMERHPNLPVSGIADVILGCANQAGEDNRNVARMALLLAGLPVTVPGQTVNRLCASGLGAVADAARAIKAGEGEIFIAGGVESMTRAPYVLSKTSTPFGRNAELFDTSIGWRFVNPKMKELYGIDSMGETAENVAHKFSISRQDQDAFALASQQKAAKARAAGRFEREIVPVMIPKGKGESIPFATDEFIRADSTIEALTKLKAAFKKDGTVTAGNSSGINDGACALLLASSDAVQRYHLTPKARVVTAAAAGVEPRLMGMGPVPAVEIVLKRAGLSLKEMSVIELNEAFAAQSLGCIRELGLDDHDGRINPNGGAIALGHPLGMSGARLALTAMHELHISGGQYALCTMCVGVGQGMAMIIERV